LILFHLQFFSLNLFPFAAGAAAAAAQAASGVGCPNAVLPGSTTGTQGGFIQMIPSTVHLQIRMVLVQQDLIM